MSGYKIYLATRKKNDFAFNHYLMRPIAGYVVALLSRTSITPNQVTIINLLLFVVAALMLMAMPSYAGGLWAVAVLELSYLLDCADGMLARHKKLASKAGHLFDFFTDESKALLLVAAMGVRLARTGGYGPNLSLWSAEQFLLATVFGAVVVASALSLTNFVRREEISGKSQGVEAFYETVDKTAPRSLVKRLAEAAFGFLRWLNHYPSHVFLFAIADRYDAFFFLYIALNGLYLARGWLGLLLRFSRS